MTKVNENMVHCKENLWNSSHLSGESGLSLIATCSPGLETPLCEELREIGAFDIRPGSGAVLFKGELAVAYSACLWSRLSNRILLHLATFQAKDERALYEGIHSVDWNLHIGPHAAIAVQSVAGNPPAYPAHYASLKAKDAIVDRIRERFGIRPSVRILRPDVQIHLFLDGETVSVSIDLAGEGLHKRGYRSRGGIAPLKETLAAGVLRLAGWPPAQAAILVDPMCGSGTFLIEAALMALDIAPGLGRDYFGFHGWLGHDEIIWSRLKKEAIERRAASAANKEPFIFGFDASKTAVSDALKNAANAAVSNVVQVEQRQLAHLKPPSGFKADKRPAFLVTNPPYGERMESAFAAGFLQRCLAGKLREGFMGWKAAVLSAAENPFGDQGLICQERRRLFNGPILCDLKILKVPYSTAKKPPLAIQSMAGEEDPLANRIRKNLRLLKKLMEAFYPCRIYDADIPQYNVSIDIYGEEARIKEYPRPREMDQRKADARLRHCARITSELLGLEQRALHIIAWGKGGNGNSIHKRIGRLKEVMEGEAHFLVDLDAYRECGLSLIRRHLRRLIAEKARGARFLNLYCGAGAETVSAALGGASLTRSFDPVRKNIQWSECNMALNGFSSTQHLLENADPLEGLGTCGGKFDLILLAMPPKGSKRFPDIELLMKQCSSRLSSGGSLVIFSETRLHPSFPQDACGLEVKDISRKMLPQDFLRRAGGLTCLIFSPRRPLG